MQNYIYSSTMLDTPSYLNQSNHQSESFFSSSFTGDTSGPQITSTPQRFILPTTATTFTQMTMTPSDVHTVPQFDATTTTTKINESENLMTMMDENSSSQSYTIDTDDDSEGELCIDESSIVSSTEDDQERSSSSSSKKRRYDTLNRRSVIVSPGGLQLNLLDRYKIPSQIPVIYHKNMARQFPETHGKTEQQKIQRKKNTEAARQSRAKAKILETIVESECRQAATENINAKRMIATQRAYANTLLKLLGNEEVDWSARWKEEETEKSRFNNEM